MRITVHGSTGAQGGPIAKALTTAGHEVLGITRSASPTDTTRIAADIEDQASLEVAYCDADGVFIHLPIPAGPDDAGRWVPAILGALTNSNVKRVVFSTSGASLAAAGDHPMMQGRLAGVQAFHRGLTQVVDEVVAVAPRLFLENLLLPFVSGPALADGVLAYPLPADKEISWISHLDVAKAVVSAFDPSSKSGAYDLGLPAVTGTELAARVGKGVGKELRFESISPAEFIERATPLFGASLAAGVGGLYEAFQDEPTLRIADDAAQIDGGDRLSIDQWAQRMLAGN